MVRVCISLISGWWCPTGPETTLIEFQQHFLKSHHLLHCSLRAGTLSASYHGQSVTGSEASGPVNKDSHIACILTCWRKPYLTRGCYGSLCLTHVGKRSMLGLLVNVVHWLRVFLLVVNEGAAVRAGPARNKIMYFNISTVSCSHLHLSHL